MASPEDNQTLVIISDTELLSDVILSPEAIESSEVEVILDAGVTVEIVSETQPQVELIVETAVGPQGPPSVSEGDMPYAERVDFIGETLIYRGYAVAGTAPSAPGWRLKRVTIAADGDAVTEWADGEVEFTKTWNDRAAYSYT